METFEERLDGLSVSFHQALTEFNMNTTPHMLGIFARQIYFAEEFEKVCANIKVAC